MNECAIFLNLNDDMRYNIVKYLSFPSFVYLSDICKQVQTLQLCHDGNSKGWKLIYLKYIGPECSKIDGYSFKDAYLNILHDCSDIPSCNMTAYAALHGYTILFDRMFNYYPFRLNYVQIFLNKAASGGHLDIVEKISIKYKLNLFGPLFKSIKHKHLSVVEFLVEKGANIEVMNKDYDTPITKAMKVGSLEIVQYLIKKGAIINNHKAFFHAREYFYRNSCNMTMINELLKHKIDEEVIDLSFKEHLIHKAAHADMDDSDFINAILQYQPSLIEKNLDHLLKIFWHRFNYKEYDVELLKILLDNGFDPNITYPGNNYYNVGKKLIVIAIENNNINMVQLLLEYNIIIDNQDDLLLKAYQTYNINMFRLLAEHGAVLYGENIPKIEYYIKNGYINKDVVTYIESLKISKIIIDNDICQCITKKGTKCNKATLKRSKYCSIHINNY